MGPGQPQEANAMDPNQVQELSPEKKEQIKMVNSTLTDMLYHPDAKAHIQSMLKQGDPMQTIPAAVNTIFSKFEDMASKGKGAMPLDIKLAGGIHLFSEVMELAEAQGVIPEDLPKEQLQPLLKATMQQYIQKGLKDKTIDPIELQKQVEPLLSQEEREIGLDMAGGTGTPNEMSQSQGMQGIMQKQNAPMQAENQMLQKQNKGMQQALQGISQGPQEGGQA
jgi:hypothetical protein